MSVPTLLTKPFYEQNLSNQLFTNMVEMMGYTRIIKNLTLPILLAMSPLPAIASMPYFTAPYAGVEAIQTNQNYKTGFGKDIFKKNPQDYNIFAGFNFTKHFGIEAGYEFQPKRSKNTTLVAGQASLSNEFLVGSDTETYTSNIRGYHPYLGLFAELEQCYPWFGKIKYQALVGASFSTIKAQATNIAFDGVPIDPFVSTFSKYKTVFLAKLMIGHNFTDHFGLRISGQYRNLSTFKINSSGTSTAILKLKDTWGVGIGLTYYFCKF